MTSDKDLVIEQMNTQFQKGGDDYGLFAIATATTPCCGGTLPTKMQCHLLTAFEMKQLPPFPSVMTSYM